MNLAKSFTVCILLLSISCTYSDGQVFTDSQSVQPNALWIQLSKTAVSSAGEKFNATIWINVTESTYAWQTKVHFNTTFLNISNAGYTYGNRSLFFSEFSTISVSPLVNHEEGYILCGESLLENVERGPGYGSLVWIEFELTDTPFETNLTQTLMMTYGNDTFVLNPFLETIPFDTIQGATVSLQYLIPSTTTPSIPPTATIIPPETLLLVAGISLAVVIAIILVRRRRLKSNE